MFALAGMLAGNFGAVIHDGLLGLRHGDRLLLDLRARGFFSGGCDPPTNHSAGGPSSTSAN